MKKLMTLMLGLSFLMGTVSLFAQDKPADDAPRPRRRPRRARRRRSPTTDTDKKSN